MEWISRLLGPQRNITLAKKKPFLGGDSGPERLAMALTNSEGKPLTKVYEIQLSITSWKSLGFPSTPYQWNSPVYHDQAVVGIRFFKSNMAGVGRESIFHLIGMAFLPQGSDPLVERRPPLLSKSPLEKNSGHIGTKKKLC